MKVSKTSRSKNKGVLLLIVLAIVILGIGGSVSAYYLLTKQDNQSEQTSTESENDNNRNDVNLDPSTEEQRKAGSDIKKDALQDDDEPPQNSLTVSFTAVSQNETTLQIRTLIEKVTSTGTCELKLTKGSSVVTKISSIQALASSSTCQGFDIPMTELTQGEWTAELTVTSEGLSGTTSRSIKVT